MTMTLNNLLVLVMPFSLGTTHFHARVKSLTKIKLVQSDLAYDWILVTILVSVDIRTRFNHRPPVMVRSSQRFRDCMWTSNRTPQQWNAKVDSKRIVLLSMLMVSRLLLFSNSTGIRNEFELWLILLKLKSVVWTRSGNKNMGQSTCRQLWCC